MLAVELVIVLLAIFLGARLGGIGIGFAGGLGVLVLALIGVKPGSIPFDVISIIMAVIAAISAMQVAGGMDYLVQQTEKLLRKNPKHITILAPIVTYFLTIFAGTGNISLSALPVIAEVAKEQGIKPCRPLSTAVVSAQIAITASPIYYIHVLDKVQGAAHFMVSDDEARAIMQALLSKVSGYLVPRLTREVGGEPSKTPIDLRLMQE